MVGIVLNHGILEVAFAGFGVDFCIDFVPVLIVFLSNLTTLRYIGVH